MSTSATAQPRGKATSLLNVITAKPFVPAQRNAAATNDGVNEASPSTPTGKLTASAPAFIPAGYSVSPASAAKPSVQSQAGAGTPVSSKTPPPAPHASSAVSQKPQPYARAAYNASPANKTAWTASTGKAVTPAAASPSPAVATASAHHSPAHATRLNSHGSAGAPAATAQQPVPAVLPATPQAIPPGGSTLKVTAPAYQGSSGTSPLSSVPRLSQAQVQLPATMPNPPAHGPTRAGTWTPPLPPYRPEADGAPQQPPAAVMHGANHRGGWGLHARGYSTHSHTSQHPQHIPPQHGFFSAAGPLGHGSNGFGLVAVPLGLHTALGTSRAQQLPHVLLPVAWQGGGYPPRAGAPTVAMPGPHGHTPRLAPPQAAGVGRATIGAYFADDSIRMDLQLRAHLLRLQWAPSADDAGPPVPPRLGPYHTLYPLDPPHAHASQEAVSPALQLHSSLYKGISTQDGSAVALRRIDPKQVIPTAELLARSRACVDVWSQVANHPNLVALRAVFVSDDVDSMPALVFAHDYHPRAVSLAAAHLAPQMGPSGLVSAPQPPSEEVLWSYLVQMCAALRACHAVGLPLRPACLHPSKVLMAGYGRLRVGCCLGVPDALHGDGPLPGQPLEHEVLMHRCQEDLVAVGQLMMGLACAGLGGASGAHLDTMALHYSHDLVRVVGALLAGHASGAGIHTVSQLAGALAERALMQMDSASLTTDMMLHELSREVENGRLLRLLVKMCFINERPAAAGVDPAWCETGDRYILKLFRDYVFHQQAPPTSMLPGVAPGGPLLDWGHIAECLTKLDAGVAEDILLMSRDEAALLVVSYADVKRCLESSYAELKGVASTSASKSAVKKL